MAKKLIPDEEPKLSRRCSKCGCRLQKFNPSDLCPNCTRNQKYQQVKEYVSTHDVTEFEVAEMFDVSLSDVRKWIDDGFLEYREVPAHKKLI